MKTLLRFFKHFTNVQEFVDLFHYEVMERGHSGEWGMTGTPSDPTLATRWSAFRRVLGLQWDYAVGEALLPWFRRRQFTANPADPTTVITFKNQHIELVSSWVVASHVRLFGRVYRAQDARWAEWLISKLEAGHEHESFCDSDDFYYGHE